MPGVKVVTATRGGAGSALRAPHGTWFLAGVTERGPVGTPIELRGMSDYAAICGDPVSYGTVYDQLRVFFAEGGARAYLSRQVGVTPTVGTITLNDRAGTPVPTLRIDADNPGAWSGRLTLQVLDGTVTNSFRITVLLDGVPVEDKDNLTSPAAAATAFSTSFYVTVTDLISATVSPNNRPAVVGPSAFTTQGTDDRGTLTDTIRVAALAVFSKDLGGGLVAIPGSNGTTIYNGILAHCLSSGNRVGALAAARVTTQATLKTTAAGFAATAGAEFLGLFAPWILVDDGAGGSKAISPEGYAAACRNRACEQSGPWVIPAGDIATAQTVMGVDAPFDDDAADDLDASRVNVIRAMGGTPTLYGWRSLSVNEIYYYWLKNRDVLNYIAVNAKPALRGEVFQNIDGRGHELSNVKNDLIGLLDPIRSAGGLFEMLAPDGQTLLDPGYVVDVGSDNNPLTSLQAQQVQADIYVRQTPGASLLKVTVTEVGLTAAI